MGMLRRAIMLIASIFICTCPSAAKVVKLEILKVESPAFEGRTFGAVGTYDRILARATIAVTPDDTNNKVIVDSTVRRATRRARSKPRRTSKSCDRRSPPPVTGRCSTRC